MNASTITRVYPQSIRSVPGQETRRGLADALQTHGLTHHIIGGAKRAAGLDAKRVIREAAELAAALD